jgi:hypothetical protein
VCIVHYRTPELLADCLSALEASVDADSFEIMVVDNGSPGFDAQRLRARFPRAVVLVNDHNLGFARASNQAMRVANGRYVLLLNPDSHVEPTAIATVRDFMDSFPDIGCATARIVLPDGRLDLACRRLFPTPERAFYRMTMLSRLFPRHHRFGQYNLTYLDEMEQTDIDSPCGAFMMVRSEVVSAIGMLDERYFMYGEDLDWSYRIKQAGWRIVYQPAATVHHVKRASSRRDRARAIRWFYDAMRHFYRTHYEPMYPRIVSWAIYLAINVREALELTWTRLRGANDSSASPSL